MKKFLTEGELRLDIPENKYRIYPILHNMCDHPENAEKDVRTLIEGGAGGTVTNTTWERKEWTHDKYNTGILRDAVKKIKENGLNVWMYDDYYYPSGCGNGYVVKDHPENFAKAILFRAIDVKENCTYMVDQDNVISLGVYDEQFNLLSSEEKVNSTVTVKSTGKLIIFYHKLLVEEVQVGQARGAHSDHLSRRAMEAYIEHGLKPVEEEVGLHNFDGIFTDEPTLTGHVLSFKRGKVDFSRIPLPYTEELFDRFYKDWGYRLENKLIHLITGSSIQAKITRIHYYKTVSRLGRENYIDVIRDYLNEHGTLASGHFLLEEGLKYHVGYYGDFMRIVGGQDIPGCDILCADAQKFFLLGSGFHTSWAFAGKYPSSLSRLKGHNVTMMEICPVNYTEKVKIDPYKEIMGLSTYAIFAGITHYNAYGYFFIKDAEQHKQLNNYVGRLLTILRNSVPDTPVAVYYPINAMQAEFYSDTPLKPDEVDFCENADKLENRMELLLDTLYKMHTDFNIIDEDNLLSADITDTISKGIISAKTLIVPFTEIIPEKVLERIERFKENGGRVIFIDTAPKYFETGEEINKRLEYISLEELPLQDGLTAEQPFTVTGDDIYVSPYTLRGKKLSYVINLTEEDREITVINGRIYDPEDNTYTENEKYVLKAERGIMVFER